MIRTTFRRLASRLLAPLVVIAAPAFIAAGAPQTASPSDPAVPADGPVVRVPITGTIELGLAPFVERSVREAEAAGARALILHIETPGGRIDAAQRIVDAVSDAAIPVYAFIDRRAFSAGAMIALAADGVYMRPGSVIGAATPVDGGGNKASEKIVSAMRSEMRALAEARGLDPRVAEAMVDEDIEIPGLVEKGKLLTLTTEEAVRVGYAAEVEDWDALLAALGLASAPIHEAEVNWAEGIVRFLTHPIVAPLLLTLGILGLIIEFKTPSFGLAGAAGLASLALFFGSHYLIGLAGREEILLLLGGLVAIGIEAFVIPGFGLFGILGSLGVLGSIYFSMVGRFATAIDYSQAAGALAATLASVLVIGWVVLRHLPRSRRLARSGLLLGEATTREDGYLSAAVRAELEGATGVALTDLRPSGIAMIGDERVDVVAEEGWLAAGTPLRVVRSEGYRHVVRAQG
jgi:membrane-bound serine protease (ClpP class)